METNLGIFTEGNLLLCYITPSTWGSPTKGEKTTLSRHHHITCTLCKNKLDRHLHGLLQILSWLISRLHANVVPYTNQTRYFNVASLTFGVRVATNATSQTSFNACPPCGFEFIKSTSPSMLNLLLRD